MERIYVDKTNSHIERTDMYIVRLVMTDGTVFEELEPRMLFPFTNESKYITLLGSDEKEVALIKDLDDLDPDSKKAITECFREYYLIPSITSVVNVFAQKGIIIWTVETDRGKIKFRIKNSSADIKTFRSTGRMIIRDTNDNRYEIPDYRKLDAHSQKLLFSFL